MQKTCTICGISKPLEDFCKRSDGKLGREARCRKCRTFQHNRYVKHNKASVLRYQRKWRQDNPEKVNAHQRKHYHKYIDIQRSRLRQKYQISAQSEQFRLHNNIRSQIRHSLKGLPIHKWEKLVGYDCQELKAHLEKLFQTGMNWDNYGEWHIDHIRPFSSFKFNNVEDAQFKECWILSNLQPLWAKENQRKAAKIA